MWRQTDRQEGSIPMVLLAVIIIGGVLISLYAIVQTGVRSSAVDRDANQSIQVADAGVQEATVLLRGVEPDEVPGCDAPAGHTNTPEEGRCAGDIGEHTGYEWRYTQTAPYAYDVEAVGAYRDHDSAVSVEIIRPLRFQMAITVKDQFTYNGAGGGIDPPIAVGTYNNATVNGNPAINSISGITMFYEDVQPDPSSFNISPESLVVPTMSSEGPDMTEDLARDACFDDDGVLVENDPDAGIHVANDVPHTLYRGHIYCVRSAQFSGSPYVVEDPSDYDPTEPEPAWVFVVGNADGTPAQGVKVGGGGPALGVNWGSEPNAGKMFIAVAQGAGNVTISGNARIAAAVWAPWSSCTWNGNPDYRGAVVCDSVTLNGNFQYDDSVNESSIGEVVTRYWSQERVPAWGDVVGPTG